MPRPDPDEKASNTIDLCLKVFSGIGVDVSASDNDIAHGVPTRKRNGRRMQASQPLANPPIICKFTRRIIRNDVLSKSSSNELMQYEFLLSSSSFAFSVIPFIWILRIRNITHTIFTVATMPAYERPLVR